MNVARLKEEQQRDADRQRSAANGKRRAVDNEEEHVTEQERPKKRKLSLETSPQASIIQSAGTFPSDFFSNPLKAPLVPSVGEDTDEEVEEAAGKVEEVSPIPVIQNQPAPSAIDAEWEKFQQTVLDDTDGRDTAYERATIFVEPVLAVDVPEGFPPREVDDGQAEEEHAPATEEELRRKKEQDERELIMDRLMEEEMAQEEADAKVFLLKQRLARLRKNREQAKAGKRNKQ